MGKKRKHAVAAVAEAGPVADAVVEEEPRPKRSLLGLIQDTHVHDANGQEANGHDDGESNGGDQIAKPPVFRNKEKVLILCSRRITFGYRHLMMDMASLLPHSKRDVKITLKGNKADVLNELVDLKGCTSCLFFECRKKKDLYMWISKSPRGPSAKFLVNAVHTMEELKLTGNHLKGSRPLLTFSSTFDQHPHLQLLKELFVQVYSTPKDQRKAKPFFDHILSFTVLDNRIWFRNYQISVPHHGTGNIDKASLDKMTLIEVGPRFTLDLIKIFGGSFGGQTLYENPFYVSPNKVRSDAKRVKAGKYVTKVKAKQRRKQHLATNQFVSEEFDDMWQE